MEKVDTELTESTNESISRRDFLKMSAGALGVSLLNKYDVGSFLDVKEEGDKFGTRV